MNQWVNFAEIRQKVSLEDVIFRYYRIETLRRKGDRVVGKCPVHGGDSPTAFNADLSRSVWSCFTRCPEDKNGGNQLDFVAYKENISIRDAALRLKAFFLGGNAAATPATARPPDPIPIRAGVTAMPHPAAPAAALAPAARAERKEDDDTKSNPPLDVRLDLKADHPHLIQDRGLTPSTIDYFGIGWSGRGIMRGCIAIPIHDGEGHLVAYAGRRLKPADAREFGKYKLPKGFKKEILLFNYHRAKEHMTSDGLIVVEGYFKVMALHQAGLPNTVATMGRSLSREQALLLAAAKEVIILFDGNDAGRIGAEAAVKLLAEVAPQLIVRRINLPDGVEPDHLTPKTLRWAINGARTLNLSTVSFTFPTPKPSENVDPPTA